MTRLVVLGSMIVCLCSAGVAVAEDGGPSADVPELKVLDHYAGTWDVQIASKEFPFSKGQDSARWILDGRFLQQSGELRSQEGSAVLKVTTLMTYDPAGKVYRSWTFMSDGAAIESEGTWDPKARVMTSVSRKDGNGGFLTTTADFSEPGVETWKIVYTDRDGKVVSETSGKNTRRAQ